jgi:hypothetical protein
MLRSLTITKASKLRWLLIGTVFFLLTIVLYLLKRPLHGQQQHSVPIGAHHVGATTSLVSSEPSPPMLRVTSIMQHGRIVEIQGTTAPGAVVMINGQPAATLFDGNQFRHFVGPLPAGTSIITMTSQNDQGGVNTQQMAVTVD